MRMIKYFNDLVNEVVSTRWLFFALWTAWVTLEYWALGPGSFLRIHDTANTHIPVVMMSTQGGQLVSGDLIRPWLSGIDRLSNFGFWHLFYLPFTFLPAWLAHGLITFIQRFVAGYFMARLMEQCLGARRSIAYAAGMVYSLVHTDLGEVAFMHMLNEPGLPLLLWAFCRMPLNNPARSLLYSSMLGIGLGWAMSGIIGIYFLVPAAFLFVWVVRADVRSVRQVFMLAICFGVFCAVALVRQIPETWALLVHSGDSYRAQSMTYGGVNWPNFWKERLNYLASWWPFVVLTSAWIWQGRLRGRFNLAIGLLLFTGVLFGPMLGPIKLYFNPYIGFLRGVDFTRFHMVSALAWTIAAVSSFAYLPEWRCELRDTGGRRLRAWSIAQIACAFVALFAFLWSVSVKQDHFTRIIKLKQYWRALYEHPDIKTLVDQAKPEGHRFATAGAYYNLHPGFWLPYGADMADGHSPMYSARYYQFWTSVIRPLIGLDKEIEKFHRWGQYVYLHHARSGPEYESPVIPFERWYDLELLSLAGVRYIISHKEVVDDRLVPLDLPGQKAAMTQWAGMGRNDRVKAYLTGNGPVQELKAYENKAALPRFFLAGGFEVYENQELMSAAMESAALDVLASRVFVTKADLPEVPEALNGETSGVVRMLANGGSRLAALVDIPAPRILVCNNQYFRWWKWTIDGRPLEMFPAYGAFMAAVVPAGQHRVELVYDPPYAELMGFLAGRFD